ncbi:MAG: D-alanyl-D-alanine carboxypeptidase [Thermodesulfobacteriota bacterium]
MNKYIIAFILFLSVLSVGVCNKNSNNSQAIPDEILEIMNKPRYLDAVWSLRVVDLDTGELIYNLEPNLVLLTGSLRKAFSSGLSLDELGVDHRFKTPVHRQGNVDGEGVLQGNLILVADGDLTLGGRVTPEETIQFTDFDHVDANALGSAVLTPQDPLTGLNNLAQQVADSGIKEINGDVIVDARLFDEFVVPNRNRLISPIIVNENLIDVTIVPTEPGQPAIVDWRPKSAAFEINANVMTVGQGEELDIELSEPDSSCFESQACVGVVQGVIPSGFKPDLPEVETLVQTFQIENPSAYARTTFIEALNKAGVTVNTNLVGPNPVTELRPPNSYSPDTLIAEYVSPPFSEMTKLVLKVSHNYGANLSLVLFGLAKGERTVDGSLDVERMTLVNNFNVPGDGFNFPTNGSGSPDSEASPRAVTTLLNSMKETDVFDKYFDSFPLLGEEGSLKFVDVGSPATGRVRGKTGTSIGFDPDTQQFIVKAKSLGGYIDSASDRRLIFAVFVNNALLSDISEVFEVSNDLGEIATKIYELN